jgi:hypothetical protein
MTLVYNLTYQVKLVKGKRKSRKKEEEEEKLH